MKDMDCMIYGLIVGCPLDKNGQDCPLYVTYRKLPLKERITLIFEMNSTGRKKKYCQQMVCLETQVED